MAAPLFAAAHQRKLDEAAAVLEKAASSGQVLAASLHFEQRGQVFARSFGAAKSPDEIFLLASISKPISAAAVMTLYDQKKFSLDDKASKFIPELTGQGREQITMRQLLTHVSGLPDQLPNNARLRSSHAGLAQFVKEAVRTPLLFQPGSRYSYSSMGILLAAEAAQRISGMPFAALVEEAICKPLGMKHSAMGLGKFELSAVMRVQTEGAAPESGGGDEAARDWDWNSPYWRKLGAPWGGAHGSAPDVARFLSEFTRPGGKALQPETARLMVANHNARGLRPRGLGFDIGRRAGGEGACQGTFGHEGATGTICWADPESETICVVLTTLPLGAASPHPAKAASDLAAP